MVQPPVQQELQQLLNKHSKDAETGVPDFILTRWVNDQLSDLAHMHRLMREHEGK